MLAVRLQGVQFSVHVAMQGEVLGCNSVGTVQLSTAQTEVVAVLVRKSLHLYTIGSFSHQLAMVAPLGLTQSPSFASIVFRNESQSPHLAPSRIHTSPSSFLEVLAWCALSCREVDAWETQLLDVLSSCQSHQQESDVGCCVYLTTNAHI